MPITKSGAKVKRKMVKHYGTKKGKQVFYAAADEHIQCVIEDMVAHISEPDQNEEDD
ncbi:hypothetical protein LCGC14_2348130 [marine sediment metagenome]|uniref:Uncharacterized protein n=1 Tax=marine sediment metagenome TaxID=412755 RepID=A0A0F9CAR4_9ZZZZ